MRSVLISSAARKALHSVGIVIQKPRDKCMQPLWVLHLHTREKEAAPQKLAEPFSA